MLLDAGADPRLDTLSILPFLLSIYSLLHHRVKDKQGSVPAEYLFSEEAGGVDRALQRALAIATAEANIAGNSADLASDGEDDGEMSSGSDQE